MMLQAVSSVFVELCLAGTTPGAKMTIFGLTPEAHAAAYEEPGTRLISLRMSPV